MEARPQELPGEDPQVLLRMLDPGLQVKHLHDAIRAGEADRRTSTRDDPANAPGTRDYFLRVRTLRQVLRKDLGWRRYDVNGLPLVINPDKTVGIGVAQGDAGTGIPTRQPKTRRPVGEIKKLLVQQNQLQLGLFDLPTDPAETKLSDEELARLETWFLLTYRFSKDGTVIVRNELSRAVMLDGKGYPSTWKPRIFLPPLEFEGVIDYIEGTDDGPEEFNVQVEER
ncbi:hypothetical protein [Actinomadura sp. HBU206391]|uniref:hypothetical protein n=1 Tax=Actinomadura sp. HBU206391 TaxID=2731692 RepID=UPI00164F21D6|nr:hypothetical protein [Actinomadura sp. HBU206391]MBC6457748.1 hypothetical protein [Actinomadura sp. HBU206391]